MVVASNSHHGSHELLLQACNVSSIVRMVGQCLGYIGVALGPLRAKVLT